MDDAAKPSEQKKPTNQWLLISILVVAIIIFASLFYFDVYQGRINTSSVATTQTPSKSNSATTKVAIPANLSDTQLQNALDGSNVSLSSLNSDASSAQAGVNDSQTNLNY